MPLNENAKKWVEALRSGKYEQGNGQLCQDNKYCCLGVACVVAKENGLDVKIEQENQDSTTRFDGAWAYLPETVQNWLGIKNERGQFGEEYPASESLAGLNDTGSSFEEIADTIEKQADKLFI